MKRNQSSIIAIFALIIFGFGATAANAQFGGILGKAKDKIDKAKQEAEKAKQEAKKIKDDITNLGNMGRTGGAAGGSQTEKPAPITGLNGEKSWVTFSKMHTLGNEHHTLSVNTLGCGDGIFATINFSEPTNNAGGYTVSLIVDGKVASKEQLSGGSATSVNETIHIEVVPDADAHDAGYPKVTLRNAKNILNKLPQGEHTIKIAVSLNDDPSSVAVGEIQYTGGAGCDIKDQRKPKSQKDTTKTDNNPPPVSKINHIEFMNNCTDDRKITYVQPDGTFSVIYIVAGFPNSNYFPVGTKFWHGNGQHGDSFLTLPASRYNDNMSIAQDGVRIKLCN